MMSEKKTNLKQSAKVILYKNSIDYVRQVFIAYDNNNIVIPLNSAESASKFTGMHFDEVVDPKVTTGWYGKQHSLQFSDDIATVSFTSGTQGQPKGIVLTHSNLSSTIQRLNGFMEIDNSIREYIGVPIYHSFGFGRVRACLSAGGQIYIPENGFNPVQIAELLESGEINAISAVPTLWRLLLGNLNVIGDHGKKVKWIEIGSQYMSREEKEKMKALFPRAVIVQHYGLTEASRSSLLDISNSTGHVLESVGKATDDVEIRCNTDGLIEIKGKHVAAKKLGQNGFEKLTDSDGWFVTSDKGKIVDDYLYYLGRADDIINIGGLKVAPDLVEREIMNALQIESGIAITGVSDSLRGEGILVVSDSRLSPKISKIKEATKHVLAGMNVFADSSLHFETIEKFPTTDTGKVKRAVLKATFEQKTLLNDQSDKSTKSEQKFGSLIAAIKSAIGTNDILPSDCIIDLGVDSLQVVIASIEVNNYLGFLPDNWVSMSFDRLEQLNQNTHQLSLTKQSIKKPIYTILLIVVIFTIGEMFLQIRSHIKTGRSALNLITNESTIVLNKDLGLKTYRPDLKIYDDSTGRYRMEINSLGLRSPEISFSPDNELRLAVVGASTVAGAFANSNDETFSQILASKLGEITEQKVNVINGGIAGLTLNNIVETTQKLIYPLKPSMIIIYTGFNDLTGICKENEVQKKEIWKPWIPTLPNWVMSNEMIRKNTIFFRTQKSKNTHYLNPQTIDLSTYHSELEYLVSDILKQGIEPVLMTNARAYNNVPKSMQYDLATGSLYYYYCLDLEGVIVAGNMFNEMIRDVAKKYNTKLVDLSKSMPGGKGLFIDDGHFTLQGEHFTAQKIIETIMPSE